MYYIDCYDDETLPVKFENRQEAIEAFKKSLEPYKEYFDTISKDVNVSVYDIRYKEDLEPLYNKALEYIKKFENHMIDDIDIPKIGALYYKEQ